MKHHPAWLAVGLLVFVVLACSFGKKTSTNTNSNSNSDSTSSPAADLGSGVAIKEIYMAKDDGDGKPGAVTDSFEPGDRTIHCIANLREQKSGTQMRFAWWVVDADGRQNQKIKDIEYTTKSREYKVHGHLTFSKDWPAGKYKVQVYVNGDLDKTVFYTIQ